MTTAHIFEELVALGLLSFITWLYHYWVKGQKGFDKFRGVVEWAGFSSFIVFLTLFLTAMQFKEADTETIDFLFPVLMGYMAFVMFGLPIILWFLEKVWNLLSRLAYR